MWRGDLVNAGCVGLVDTVHVRGILGAAPAGCMDESKYVGPDGMTSQTPGLAPAAFDHLVPAEDHFVEVANLVGNVVDTGPVGSVA
jgi:hypothetical protein